jgi:transposase
VLAGEATAVPKHADGQVEMIRQVKVARDTAVKARTSAMITLKQVVVNAPAELREQLTALGDKGLIARCAGFRVGNVTSTTDSAKYALRALARRWQSLHVEIVDADRLLDRLTGEIAPTLRQAFGVGPDTAAEMLVVFGDNSDRIRSDAAFAKLCGACPIPASSGMIACRHRLYRGGHRQANAALYRSVIVRMRFHEATIAYVARRTAEGRGKKEIIRCLKRYLTREVYQCVMADRRAIAATMRGVRPLLCNTGRRAVSDWM